MRSSRLWSHRLEINVAADLLTKTNIKWNIKKKIARLGTNWLAYCEAFNEQKHSASDTRHLSPWMEGSSQNHIFSLDIAQFFKAPSPWLISPLLTCNCTPLYLLREANDALAGSFWNNPLKSVCFLGMPTSSTMPNSWFDWQKTQQPPLMGC